MKAYRLIDSLWNSFEKRRKILTLAVCLFWFIQYVIQTAFFFSLSQVHNYSSLFEFMEHMDSYTGSILIRIAYQFITIPTVSLTSIFNSFFKAFSFIDVVFILLTIYWFLQADKKKACLFVGSNILMIAILFIFLTVGMQVNSIQNLIDSLYVLSLISLVLHIVFILILLFSLVQNCMKWAKLNY